MKATEARSRKSLISYGVAALLAVGAASAQIATAAGTGIDDTGSYRSEVQACMTGRTQQDQATCLLEARNALAEKRRGRLENYDNLQANAMARCSVFTASDDRAACQARVTGGETEGSVAGGGILREAETTVVVPSTSVLGNRQQ